MLWITAAWGACFITIRWGLREAPLLWFATLRAIVAGVALVAVGAAQRRPLPTGIRAWNLIANVQPLRGFVDHATSRATRPRVRATAVTASTRSRQQTAPALENA